MFLPKWPVFVGNKPPRDLKLDRVKELLKRVGNPEKNIKNIIHVAGTNGKGSTIAFLEKILIDAGFTVNKYTSPHLINFNERIILNGKEIEDNFLQEILDECEIMCKKSPEIDITFFEATTISALLAFSRREADFTLLETGMGGRLDATNIIEKPLATIITSIDFDHMEFLGNKIEDIAKEKAGIIKKNVPIIIAKQRYNKLYNLFKEIALDQNAIYYGYDDDYKITINSKKQQFCYHINNREMLTLPYPSMLGKHQIYNCASAITTIKVISKLFDQNSKYYKRLNSINDALMINSITNTHWQGRIQKITSGKFYQMINNSNITDKCDIWIDGGHNKGGAISLSSWLKQYKQPNDKIAMIFGMMKDKDYKFFLSKFKDLIDIIYLVDIKNNYDQNKMDNMEDFLLKNKFNYIRSDNLNNAINEISSAQNKEKYNKIIISGSLYLVAEFLDINK